MQALGLDGNLEYHACRTDALYAMSTGTAAYFSPREKVSEEENTQNIGSIILEPTSVSLPSGFARTITPSTYFSSDISKLIYELCKVVSRLPNLRFSGQDEKRQWNAINSLVTSLASQSAPNLSPYGDLQRPLYFALCIFDWMLRPRPLGMDAQTIISKSLRSSLAETSVAEGSLWGGVYQELLLWIVFMGMTCSLDASGLDSSSNEFMNLWYTVAIEQGLGTWIEIKLVLKDFLWIDDFNVRGSKLWRKAVEVRPAGLTRIVTLRT